MSEKIPLTTNCDISSTLNTLNVVSTRNDDHTNPLNSPSTEYQLQNIDPIKRQLDEVKQITANNIERVLERGDKIDVLVDNSEKLQNSSVQFHRNAKRLKRSMCYRKLKLYIFIIGIVSLIIYIFAAISCGNAKVRECK